MLKQRIITSLCGIPILIAAIWFYEPLPWFTVLTAIWGLLAVYEFFRLTSISKVSALTLFGLIITLLLIISRDSDLKTVIESHFNTDLTAPVLLLIAVIIPPFLLLIRRQREKLFTSWAWTVGGILYVGWLLSYLVSLRGLDDGRNWLFFALFTTFAFDTAAFFVGRAIGKHRLAPIISPGKTWEGTIGGTIGAVIVSLLFLLPTPLKLELHWGHAIILGLLVSIFGQLGDLTESLFKRKIGVKDSGNLIPGHGGVLDRMDSIVFAGAAVYYYVVIFII
jgi:phosphatidate cytidylyltransferase